MVGVGFIGYEQAYDKVAKPWYQSNVSGLTSWENTLRGKAGAR